MDAGVGTVFGQSDMKPFVKFSPALFAGAVILLSACSRTNEFREQARAGQPIVRAIEDYRRQTASYPPSLADLAPKYLAAVPDTPDKPNRQFTGWDYSRVTNGTVISYTLRYYMGRGGSEYEPPNWIGNDEGQRTIILTNE